MSAILGPNIGGGRRFRYGFPSRSSSTSSSPSTSTVGRSDPPAPFTRRGRTSQTMEGQAKRLRKLQQLAPQTIVDDFWTKFTTKAPGKATTVLPQDQHADTTPSKTTQDSYDEAAVVCRAKVVQIIKECRRVNKKYRDPHFDLESDLKLGRRDCLQSLPNVKGVKAPPGGGFNPRSAKRVTEIFDKPQFYIDGPTANDVRQGRDGDCWLMSALCTLSNKPGLIERLCVAHDQDVGVYGFVFHRDGEWISEIVDDFLYLTKPDYDESYTDRVLFDELERVNPEEAYRRIYQANSGALYFAQCEHPQETWLPLLEKCYAKAHGDYAAIEGGFGGEGIEDLTGGVTSEIFTTDILDKEYFWNEELLKVNQDFLFGCSTGVWGSSSWGERKGIVELHSYSVQRAVEIDGKRLVRLKNPWGKGEWKGAWSDGSKEWTPEWLEKLDHRFGDDGDFWISYDDLLRKYQAFERTRLFDSDWSVAQIWTTLTVPWMLDYHTTYFSLSLSKPGPVVIVFSQLDERYFRGLEGQYHFQLALRLHKKGKEDYLVRSQAPYRMRRSVNVELELEAGEYDVRVKVDACRWEDIIPTEQVIRNSAKLRREKLTRIGLAYDLAHGKGKVVETAEEKAAREAHDKKHEAKRRQEILKRIEADREEQHYLQRKAMQRTKDKERKERAKNKAKMAAMQARKRAIKSGVADQRGSVSTTGQSDVVVVAGERGNASEVETEKNEAPSHEEAAKEDTQARNATASAPQGEDAAVHGVEEQLRDGHDETFCESGSESGSNVSDELSELSERELDIQVEIQLGQLKRMAAASAASAPTAEEQPDEFERDPWNAVAVAGLRVYHRVGEGGDADVVRLKVVRPNPYADADDEAKTDSAEGKTRELDVDDSAKDATLVGGVTERRNSIVGNDRPVF
ncbi:calpain family cysteine protease [Hirsutella rhossiliensis]|uniref:Calpain family cysteine protease domain-containing protein n=1 Tax=Hirsutella rhossiliensis TaxID=111463 RepID=A0A9P8SNR2_9HYPO|nr:calpain family cysteine protease domain-containing protein [Hirsutella rhossiliensis]KAH0967416.1 calpain family cysteine protease domain-containing protein [Hirsutella rhossiliensis]